MHLCIAAVVCGLLGGLVGKLLSGSQTRTVPTDRALEQRLATARQAIADLQSEQQKPQ